MRPAKSCPVGITWAAPPPRLPCVLFEDLEGEFLIVVVFEELELELFPELELEPFPELELELELLPDLELELELFPELELELLFPPPFLRARLRRESREVMNGMNMANRKNEKEK